MVAAQLSGLPLSAPRLGASAPLPFARPMHGNSWGCSACVGNLAPPLPDLSPSLCWAFFRKRAGQVLGSPSFFSPLPTRPVTKAACKAVQNREKQRREKESLMGKERAPCRGTKAAEVERRNKTRSKNYLVKQRCFPPPRLCANFVKVAGGGTSGGKRPLPQGRPGLTHSYKLQPKI